MFTLYDVRYWAPLTHNRGIIKDLNHLGMSDA